MCVKYDLFIESALLENKDDSNFREHVELQNVEQKTKVYNVQKSIDSMCVLNAVHVKRTLRPVWH